MPAGSIIKNVKSVIVPNTGHLKGIPAPAAAGIVAGDASRELEVIASVSPEQVEKNPVNFWIRFLLRWSTSTMDLLSILW